MKESRVRVRPPIINFGRLRVDWPSRERSAAENLKFLAFVAILLLLFVLLSQMQYHWLKRQNERSQTPVWSAIERAK